MTILLKHFCLDAKHFTSCDNNLWQKKVGMVTVRFFRLWKLDNAGMNVIRQRYHVIYREQDSHVIWPLKLQSRSAYILSIFNVLGVFITRTKDLMNGGIRILVWIGPSIPLHDSSFRGAYWPIPTLPYRDHWILRDIYLLNIRSQ